MLVTLWYYFYLTGDALPTPTTTYGRTRLTGTDGLRSRLTGTV